MENTDLLEHELKFELNFNKEYLELIKKVLEPYAYMLEDGVKYVTDVYYDTLKFDFAQKGVSYRLRSIDDSKKVRINFKFPGQVQNYAYIRREIRSKVKNSQIDVDNPLLVPCIANDYTKSFMNCSGLGDCNQNVLNSKLIVNTRRECYWVVRNEKDMAGKEASLGLIYFDKSVFFQPSYPEEKKDSYEFEFELWNGGICRDVLAIHQEIGKKLCEYGLKPSTDCKYLRFLKILSLYK